ncbi:TonB C-terminal domain-containing protein [Occallatibacter riparius]|uniref:TonB C-terminal domain-containing protein n=1 Tax=Occallatibacter riparius TaxID=1002689 RepID=A0A9J7BYN5_9BACT|nr:TonB C-terminal domain-containing protein [Occallatibacter riparius]UWZ86454.1 TonB C-terminal domain-containing protein [Occallatibacter riparius]
MPTRENEPTEPTGSSQLSAPQPDPSPEPPLRPEPERQPRSTSRWVDYDTHELLEMISELEDERRWARLREGVLWAVLIHIFLLSSITWIPKYVFRVPPVIDPFDAIKQRKDLKYLDLPPDLVSKYQPKVQVKPVEPKRVQPQVDRKTLEALNKPPAPPPPAPEQPKLEQPKPQEQAPPPIPPAQQTQSQVEAPQPKAVPARPSFAFGSQNPADQLKDAMRGASRSPGYGAQLPSSPGEMSMHPGAGAGGVQILSDTQGVDFNSWLIRWHRETEKTWDPLIPDEVNPPILKQGQVQIRFRVLPNGRIQDGSMVLEGRSGDTALDRAAWGALTGSNYPPLPRDFHGPFLELRAIFMYNMRQ